MEIAERDFYNPPSSSSVSESEDSPVAPVENNSSNNNVVVAPRKRGRPPKNAGTAGPGKATNGQAAKSTVISEGPPKKRGRPPKNASATNGNSKPVAAKKVVAKEIVLDDELSESEPEELAQANGANGADNSEGSFDESSAEEEEEYVPKKQATKKTPVSGDNGEPKRKRGRPPGSKNKNSPVKAKSPSAPKKSVAQDGTPKRRGRPPKNPSQKAGGGQGAKKPRGRPPKTANGGSAPTPSASDGVKKGPGRPKKVVAAVPVTNANTVVTISDSAGESGGESNVD